MQGRFDGNMYDSEVLKISQLLFRFLNCSGIYCSVRESVKKVQCHWPAAMTTQTLKTGRL